MTNPWIKKVYNEDFTPYNRAWLNWFGYVPFEHSALDFTPYVIMFSAAVALNTLFKNKNEIEKKELVLEFEH
jgi:hypothetical protein